MKPRQKRTHETVPQGLRNPEKGVAETAGERTTRTRRIWAPIQSSIHSPCPICANMHIRYRARIGRAIRGNNKRSKDLFPRPPLDLSEERTTSLEDFNSMVARLRDQLSSDDLSNSVFVLGILKRPGLYLGSLSLLNSQLPHGHVRNLTMTDTRPLMGPFLVTCSVLRRRRRLFFGATFWTMHIVWR